MSDTDPSTATWYAKPNDLIGGWCVMDTDQTPAEAQRPEIADFTTREHAEHIADLHNASLTREHWHHAPDGSPYTRLKAYGEGGEVAPGREDVMELLRAFNAATAMNGVHRRALTRAWERLDMAQRAPGPSGLTRVWSGYDDDECWFPMFADLADAKAYAEAAYRAQCAAYGTNAPEQVAWTERTAYTEDKGFPGMFDLETGTGWVVCELLVHPSLASGLAAQPIETGDEQAVPDPQVEGQTVIALVPGRQDTAAETTAGQLPHEDYMQAVFDALEYFGLHPREVTTTTPDGLQLDGVISFPVDEFPDRWPDGVYLGWDQRGGWSLCDEGSNRNLWDLDLGTYANPVAVADRARTRLLDLPDTAPDEAWDGALDLRGAVAVWESGDAESVTSRVSVASLDPSPRRACDLRRYEQDPNQTSTSDTETEN